MVRVRCSCMGSMYDGRGPRTGFLEERLTAGSSWEPPGGRFSPGGEHALVPHGVEAGGLGGRVGFFLLNLLGNWANLGGGGGVRYRF